MNDVDKSVKDLKEEILLAETIQRLAKNPDYITFFTEYLFKQAKVVYSSQLIMGEETRKKSIEILTSIANVEALLARFLEDGRIDQLKEDLANTEALRGK